LINVYSHKCYNNIESRFPNQSFSINLIQLTIPVVDIDIDAKNENLNLFSNDGKYLNSALYYKVHESKDNISTYLRK